MTGPWPLRLIAAGAAGVFATGVAYAGASGPSIDGLPAKTVVARIAAAEARQHTLRQHGVEQVHQPSGDIRQVEDLDVDFTHHAFTLVRTESGGRSEERVIGSHVYLEDSEPVAGLPPFWRDDSAHSAEVLRAFPGSDTAKLLAGATDLVDEGIADVDGRRTRHFRLTLSAAALLEQIEGRNVDLDGVTTSGVSLDLWVGADNLPVREVDALTVSDPSDPTQTASVRATVDDTFGASLRVVAPPAKQIHPGY